MEPGNPALINSHNSWSRLREVWLGDVYPSAWYDHLEPQVRDIFYRLTEITHEDLATIQALLEGHGVTVRRPRYDRIEDFLDANDVLIKPEICPRDHFVIIGHRLLYQSGHEMAWQWIMDQYRQCEHNTVMPAPNMCVNGANVVRVGRDIVIDRDVFAYHYQGDWPEYRVHLVDNGGHLDGCFAVLKPGLILANRYFDDYERTFPGWQLITLDNPTYHAAPSTGYQQPYPVYNGKFWNTGVGTNRSFNQHIIDHALDWVGCYTETYFELNCLVIDEHNVVMLEQNEVLARELEQHGIKVHWVPFRARSFWDGAMHCLTVDIRRDSEIEDFFPERSH